MNTGHHGFREDYKTEHQRSYRSQSPMQRSEEYPYTVGHCKLRISTEAALLQRPDMIVVVGDLFQKLHDSPGFNVKDSLRRNENFPISKNYFAFYGGMKSLPIILRLFVEGFSQQSFNNAFHILDDIVNQMEELLQRLQLQHVVFTSSNLYSRHPEPGKRFTAVKRDAYLPATEEGNKVLRLLRVAFVRRLTFTIGDSRTTGREGVITWNDIHHKTSLKEGQYGYPDPNYPRNVTKELAYRGVTEASMTERERHDFEKVKKDLQNRRCFLDI
ncbi:E3 ubiquitin-protein ligase DTX3L [Elysia marginata]|uniref:E3 ubiquitin-protein ligase n=1 Tax=Elysia marginata TaxID=1093978 RepID=A0AAV4F267_9GAST|nr:E3 ubiquitin-protein ligase DTX3L [Elysia marginata]